ncbi:MULTISPECIES: polysaccharide deacetylase family protein [Cyanophyceae]|nr:MULTISPECIES: polysaccharide deacetylase family protein [Cyanophyceae]
MYHRIACPELDPWRLSVTPQHFAEHLAIIRQQAQPMSLQELAAARRDGDVPRRAVVITFDDGYADNLHQAKPLLEKYNIPATVFVTTGHLNSTREFWWDELERVLLTPGRLPETLHLTIAGRPKLWHLGEAANYTAEDFEGDRDRQAWEGLPNSRLAFYYSVWDALRKLPADQQQTLQDEILAWATTSAQARADYCALTTEELFKLEQDGLVEIGAHTVTHPSLPAHSLTFQHKEIYSSKITLEQLLKHPVKSFAYPFGDLDKTSVSIVEKCGFEQACSTIQLKVLKGSEELKLPRLEAKNWTSSVFKKNLEIWLG